MLMTGAEFGAMLDVKSLPNLHLEVSLGCNLSCAMCTFHDHLKKFQSMPLEKLLAVDTGFDRFGQVHIGDGSEPFINSGLLDIVGYLSNKGVKVSVQTNGKAIKSAKDADALVASGLMLLSISIDGVQDATMRKIRDGLGFTDIAKTIDLINAAKQRAGSKTPYLASNAVAMRCNLDQMPDLATYLLENGFCSFRIGFLELRQPNNDLAGELLIYEMPKAIEILAKVRRLIDRHPNAMHFDDGIFQAGVGMMKRENCTGYKDRFYVNYAGDMWTCYGKRKLGNIFENGLQGLIDSDAYRDYVQQVTTPANSICAACSFCQIMSLDKITDHFGKKAVEYYSLETIDASLRHAAAGGDVREFWRNYVVA